MGRSEKGDWEENMLTAVIYEGNVYGGKYQVTTDVLDEGGGKEGNIPQRRRKSMNQRAI